MITKPKGTYDVFGNNAKLISYINDMVKWKMQTFNAGYIRTPIFESSELVHRSVGESTDIVSKETYDFSDRANRKLTLRPEGTASVVRSFIENKLYANESGAIKLYYNGTMYRYERPQTGRNREFTQIGLEVFNTDSVISDAEVISFGYNLIVDLGIEDVTVCLNSLGDAKTRENYICALKEYIKPYLSNLCSDCQNRYEKNPLRILDCKVDAGSEVFKNLPVITDYLSDEAKERFALLKNYLLALDVDFEVDTSIVRGLDYYTDFVYEFKSGDGLVLGGGGRYDNLVKNLGGPEICANGFALGVERLMIELEKVNLDLSTYNEVFVLAISQEEKIHALKIISDLRSSGVSCEMCSNDVSLKSQFKMADRLESKYLILLNDEDLSRGLVTIKDNVLKTEEKIDEKEINDYFYENL